MFEQSPQATERALQVHAEAVRNVSDKPKIVLAPPHPDVARLLAVVRPMVRAFKKSGSKGNLDKWNELARVVRELDR